MQEPEIFEQPVASKDTEAHVVADENGTYRTVVSNGLGPTPGDDGSLEDYHDFFYPEGSSVCSSSFPVENKAAP